MRSLLAFLVFSSLCILDVWADDSLPKGPDLNCTNGFFPSYKIDFKVAKVKSGKAGKVKLIRDWDKCLNETNPAKACSYQTLPASVTRVLIGPLAGQWGCVYYDHDANWANLENFEIQMDTKETLLTDWVGKWKYFDNEIEITLSEDKKSLSVSGVATWQGGKSSDGYDIVHTGDLIGVGQPKSNVLIIGDEAQLERDYTDADDCAAQAKLVGEFLLVHDNSLCGGVNVRFDGVYTKR